MSNSNDESISMLISMGFDLDQSQRALDRNGGNVERAIDFLLSGSGADTSQGGVGSGTAASASTAPPSSSAATSIVTSPTSQYSDPSGRSACTAIALTMAHHALKSLRGASSSSTSSVVGNVITTEFLETSITEGIRNYSILKTRKGSVEHSSAEEILVQAGNMNDKNNNNSLLSHLKLFENSPRQGILDSHPPSIESMNINPVGLYSLLYHCQEDASRSCTGCGNFVAAVITKPPETVLVLLPIFATNISGSGDSSGYNNDSQSYILLDSHPRPNQHAPHNPQHGSYALFHSDLSGLVGSLKEIFPVTELGPDVPEMMGMMYNSFDVYPFVLPG
eukprot:CAMPEP_0171342234 /NCGR_PEP_ID=MMETSP0878-20121228/13767_1 /TAXON_ID=67004 /ORGANISM="Thalassiosira weissflogii, Strain CCMP1336" /LENGTH=334 /DNA_ID=CAMNT_0011844843 /DNA_START=33 /DNA_END=1037 /DNA_ORIENTATION=-